MTPWGTTETPIRNTCRGSSIWIEYIITGRILPRIYALTNMCSSRPSVCLGCIIYGMTIKDILISNILYGRTCVLDPFASFISHSFLSTTKHFWSRALPAASVSIVLLYRQLWRFSSLRTVGDEVVVGNRATQNKFFLALKPISSLQGEGNGSHTSLIELAEEFVDDEVYIVTIRFPQLTSVSREKMYYPPSAPTI
jgi:hypothetical protein